MDLVYHYIQTMVHILWAKNTTMKTLLLEVAIMRIYYFPKKGTSSECPRLLPIYDTILLWTIYDSVNNVLGRFSHDMILVWAIYEFP